MRDVLHSQDRCSIEALIAMEAKLASIASCGEVRRMHEDLEQFYRTRLAVILASTRLAELRKT